jgi:hypothetical protein
MLPLAHSKQGRPHLANGRATAILIPQGEAWLSGLPELTNLTYVDLPPTTGPCGRARRNWRVSSAI